MSRVGVPDRITARLLSSVDTAVETRWEHARLTGKGLGEKLTRRISTGALMRINRAVGRTIVTKYGTKRGAVALGRVLPFGIGAVIGGTANFAAARIIASQADRFFAHLPPPLEAKSVLRG